MDERKLEELFRDSVQSVPPSSFDEHDVARASRRITARRRMAAVGGTVVAAAVLVGGVGLGTGLFGQSETSHVASKSVPETASSSPRFDGPGVLGDRSGCGPDAQLAAAVTRQLPEAAETAPVAAKPCPSGSKTALFVLRDGAATGSVTVIVGPVGTIPPDQTTPGDVRRPDGTELSVRQARSGKLVVVLSDPDAGSPAAPYGARIASIAGDLAAQY
ncbi:hypothetical protein [Saccharopolyspora spinosa]|uniref:Uncharacterized protein n=1 Tax=Saccharopolyspora spinosa TaxID=60894 RepID=A0A2N3XRG0_SACSN|nr:hypothetical protein [Saccharopolyspora spinosa]PKW13239.1 hypothetical protein A8926_0748 [Saccharopolyspora spinosa]